MQENKYDLEELIHKALTQRAQKKPEDHDESTCLSNETIHRLYEGLLTDEERLKSLEHLNKCSLCLADLALYSEVAKSEARSQALAKLKQLQIVFSKLKGKLDAFDFTSLCTRLLEMSKKIIGGLDRDAIESAVEEVLARLEPELSQAAVQLRGKTEADGKGLKELSHEEMIKLGKQLEETVQRQLMLSHAQLQQKPRWSGSPELWIFEHLTDSMKNRAVCIRDWCEQKLEYINSIQELSCLPSIGVGHSKRVLGCAIEMLKVFEQRICNPLTCFVIYAGAYCQHLGLLFLGEHQTRKEQEVLEAWKDHNGQTRNLIIGNTDLGIAAAWPAMGFLSEQEAMLVVNVCTGEQRISKKSATELPTSQSIFLEGQTMNVQPLTAFAILKLATILDCSQERLPRLLCLREPKIPEDLIYEYLKHEVVREVNIDKDGTVHIKMRVCYRYPARLGNVQELVCRKLQGQIRQCQELLQQSGISLPDPEFDCGEALFLEEHPYLGDQAL
jgi:hypothetical protein